MVAVPPWFRTTRQSAVDEHSTVQMSNSPAFTADRKTADSAVERERIAVASCRQLDQFLHLQTTPTSKVREGVEQVQEMT
jgi:hypothetical protein